MRGRIIVALGSGAALLGIALAASGGCLRTTQFRCVDDLDCMNGASRGRCESIGFCSFPDSACESGHRFGELNGPESGQCVGAPPMIDAAVEIDAPDAAPDAYVHDARECFGAGLYELCFAMMPPMGMVTLTGALDTATDARCTAMPASWATNGQPDACMILGRDISVTGTLVVTGARPLVLVGENVVISAVIDIASHRGGTTAAAANAAVCVAFPTAPVGDTAGAGGGAGGSFMTIGGNGGRGENAGGTGGTAPAADATAPTVLRGGCAGQTGGTGTQAAGAAGAGGGAIYIAASRLSITGAGAINASGAGAAGGGSFSGGSGGGTGGMIVIHAVELGATTGGELVANGGGGASGADGNTNGAAGSDPNVTMVTTPALGGSAGSAGEAGGNGFAGATAAQVGAGTADGGGGGGGGGGYIQINQALPGVTASPAPTIVP